MTETMTAAVHDYLTTAPTSRFLDKEVTILDHWQGRDNLLWRVETDDGTRAVVKLYLDAGQARSRRQYRGQEIFWGRGLAPRPLWYDRYPTGLARQILVYEWVDGDPFDPGDPGQGEALADSLVRIHTSDPEDVGRISPHPFNLQTYWRIWQGSREPIATWMERTGTARLASLFSSLWNRVEEEMAAALPRFGESPAVPVHGDVRVENILVQRGRVCFLDWEMCGLGDGAGEVARFLFFSQAGWPETLRERWLQRYLAGMSRPDLAERIALYRRVLPFQSLCLLLHGIRREITGAPDQVAGLADNRAFLVETIGAALATSADQLSVESEREEISEPAPLGEIERLLDAPAA